MVAIQLAASCELYFSRCCALTSICVNNYFKIEKVELL